MYAPIDFKMSDNKKRKSATSVCAVRTCSNTTQNCKLQFFNFPLKFKRARQWAKACDCNELLTKNCRVCARHFDDTMYSNKEKTRLSLHALPVHFLHEPLGQVKAEPLDVQEEFPEKSLSNVVPVAPVPNPLVVAPTNPCVYQFFQVQLTPTGSIIPTTATASASRVDKDCQTSCVLDDVHGMKAYTAKLRKLYRRTNLLNRELKYAYALCEKYLSPEIVRFIKTESKRLSNESEVSDTMLDLDNTF